MLIYRDAALWQKAMDASHLEVHWGQNLKDLAKKLFDHWNALPFDPERPFRKVCIVVDDVVSQEWLTNYFLYEYKCGHQVLANVDIQPISRFINDWLYRLVHGNGHRDASSHPYSKDVMRWRIEAILRQEFSEYPVLKNYLTDSTHTDARRFELAEKIAELFDDYLNHRFAMLRRWEENDVLPKDEQERWQSKLYRRLMQDNPQTYVKDYMASVEIEPRQAIENGFEDYSQVFIFDVSGMSPAYLELLLGMSSAIPVSFWNFNPASVGWLDDPILKQARNEVLAELESGKLPSNSDITDLVEMKCDPLLASMGTGGRIFLGMQADLVEDIQSEDENVLQNLHNCKVECHKCYTPRRELEAVRDGISRFLKEHPDARPRDIAVLCGDWANYAPEVDAVFGPLTAESGYIPYVKGASASASSIEDSYVQLLAFASNRFEVTAVCQLLSVPAIRDKARLTEEQVNSVQDMLSKNNIHWGYNDEDVRSVLGKNASASNYPFTWRRGLDRMLVNALQGDDCNNQISNSGELGILRAFGPVEGEVAQQLCSLSAFIEKLYRVRLNLRSMNCTAKEWQDYLLNLLEDFYSDDKQYARELKQIRQIIIDMTSEASAVRDNFGNEIKYDSDLMISAITGSLAHNMQHADGMGDSVHFDALRCGCAKPYRMIWLCGLNNGCFPRRQYRSAFDLIGQHPTLLDDTVRDQDAFALLKAVSSVSDMLVFSYQGYDPRLNEAIPASVLVSEILDYLARHEDMPEVCHYDHPMQAFSHKYFEEGSKLPTSYSRENYDASLHIYGTRKVVEEETTALMPFELHDGINDIPLADIFSFLRKPDKFILRNRLNAAYNYGNKGILADDDALKPLVDFGIMQDIVCSQEFPKDEDFEKHYAPMLRDVQGETDLGRLAQAVKNSVSPDVHKKVHGRLLAFKEHPELSVTDRKGWDVYEDCKNNEPLIFTTPVLNVSGYQVRLMGNARLTTSKIQCEDGVERYRNPMLKMFYSNKNAFPLEVLLTHLALNASGTECVTDNLDIVGGGTIQSMPVLTVDDATEKLQEVLEILLAPLSELENVALCSDPSALISDRYNELFAYYKKLMVASKMQKKF